MNKKYVVGLGMAAALSLGTATLAAASEKENEEAGFVTMAFQNFCGRQPDPASLNYFINVLEEKRQTNQEVYQAIGTTCRALSHSDPKNLASDATPRSAS
jgi:hypothetical protein